MTLLGRVGFVFLGRLLLCWFEVAVVQLRALYVRLGIRIHCVQPFRDIQRFTSVSDETPR